MVGNNKQSNKECEYVCCFCHEDLKASEALTLAVTGPKSPEQVQGLYAHKKCFKKAIHKSIPIHPDFEENIVT